MLPRARTLSASRRSIRLGCRSPGATRIRSAGRASPGRRVHLAARTHGDSCNFSTGERVQDGRRGTDHESYCVSQASSMSFATFFALGSQSSPQPPDTT